MRGNKAWILPAIGMLTLILDTKTAILGAKDALSYCLLIVIPTLFPFFMLSILLTSSIAGRSPSMLHPFARLLRIPKGGESLFLVGLLGGYPTGAQAIADSYQQGSLTKQQARRMMGFCSNAGPAFIFGMIGPCFDTRIVPWALWGIHIISAILTGMVLPGGTRTHRMVCENKHISLNAAFQRSLHIMANVCGWIVLFRVIITFLQQWVLWLFPEIMQYAIIGLLELANGCSYLPQIHSESIRFLLCSVILSFGGLCVAMQTSSVTVPTGLGMYLPGKCLQSLFSLWLAALAQSLLFHEKFTLFLCLTIPIAIIFLINIKKRIAFRKNIVYNKTKSLPEARICCSERKFKNPAHIAPMP